MLSGLQYYCAPLVYMYLGLGHTSLKLIPWVVPSWNFWPRKRMVGAAEVLQPMKTVLWLAASSLKSFLCTLPVRPNMLYPDK